MSGKNCVRLMLHRQRSHMTLIHMVPLLTNDSKGGFNLAASEMSTLFQI